MFLNKMKYTVLGWKWLIYFWKPIIELQAIVNEILTVKFLV
jgi:hypothetical protein